MGPGAVIWWIIIGFLVTLMLAPMFLYATGNLK